MKPTYLIAKKSIFANKSRSIVTILLMTFSTAILIFSSTLMDGEHKIMLKNAVEVYPGYIQITDKAFRDNPSFDHLIFDVKEVTDKLDKNKEIDTYASRFETFVLFSAKEKTIGAMITGIEPEREKQLSKLSSALKEGAYLGQDDTSAIYIGSELAKRLGVGLGDELSFIGSSADYSFCADTLRIKGIFETGLYQFDNSSSFVNRAYFDQIFVSDNLATHIIVLPKKVEHATALANEIQHILPSPLVAESWTEFMEDLVKAMELDSIFGYVTLGIFFIVIFFVVMIYTLLVVFSRVKEIGVLRAIGTSNREILTMLLAESALLSLISVIFGGLIGGYLAYYFNIHPIDFGKEFEEQFKQYGIMSTALPTDFNLFTIFRDMVIMLILGILCTLYPIFKINALTPSEAMRHV